jgi:hypothetical protein
MIYLDFAFSSFQGSSLDQVLPLDEQEWWMGMDANKGITHSPSLKSWAETNVMPELHSKVTIMLSIYFSDSLSFISHSFSP